MLTPPPLRRALACALASFCLTFAAQAQDGTPPTCVIEHAEVTASHLASDHFRFTLWASAGDDTALRSPFALEYRFRTNRNAQASAADGGYKAWQSWPADFSDPIFVETKAPFIYLEVRSVDAAGNFSAVASRQFEAPYTAEPLPLPPKFSTPKHFTNGGTAVTDLVSG